MTRRASLALALACTVIVGAACTSRMAGRVPAERLFFAVEIMDGDRVVAHPLLLGETGKRLTLKHVSPERPDQARLALELVPEKDGDGYRVQLKLALPDRAGVKRGVLALEHGEERALKLADPVRPLTVRLLLMRVASPEFEAWLRLAGAAPTTS
jgi:hypothetical protein